MPLDGPGPLRPMGASMSRGAARPLTGDRVQTYGHGREGNFSSRGGPNPPPNGEMIQMLTLGRAFAAVVALLLISLFAAGCGSDDPVDEAGAAGATTATAPPETQPATTAPSMTDAEASAATPTTTEAKTAQAMPTRVRVTLGSPNEFSLVSSATRISAGEAIFTVINEGQLEHELVMVKTPKDAANLSPEDIVHGEEKGRVNEHPEHQAPGETMRFRADLEPGHYVLLCNVAGHYQAGQYLNFVVT